jgi:hypothetical protein
VLVAPRHGAREPDVTLRQPCPAAPPAAFARRDARALRANAWSQRGVGDVVASCQRRLPSAAKNRDDEWSFIGTATTLGVPSTPRRATLDVQLVCRETTKYHGMGVLHNFLRGGTDFHHT